MVEYTPEFKTQVAIKALNVKKSDELIAAEYGISPAQVADWRNTVLASMSNLLSKRKLDKDRRRVEAAHQKRIARLQAQVDKWQGYFIKVRTYAQSAIVGRRGAWFSAHGRQS